MMKGFYNIHYVYYSALIVNFISSDNRFKWKHQQKFSLYKAFPRGPTVNPNVAQL